MIDTLSTVAHESGYLHGIFAGAVMGGLVATMACFAIAAFVAASEDPPAPGARVQRPELRVVRGGRR